MQVQLNRIDGIEQFINVQIAGVNRLIAQYICDENIGVYKKQGKERCLYIREPMFIDTETSHNHDEENPIGWVYQWASVFNGYTVGGRTPRQLVEYLKKYVKLYQLSPSRKMVCYIHNLSYDITYLADYLAEEFGEIKMLNIKAHKVLSFECVNVGLVFKCSYLLSNRGLYEWNKYTKSPVVKVVNGIDYNAIRYQDTPLTYNDWFYQINDVWSMYYSYKNMLAMFNDDIVSIPLTNTGYIRRDVRNEFKKDEANRKEFLKNKIDAELYRLFRNEFAGGLSHGNRHYIAKMLKCKIGYYDYKSDYPSQQQLKYYPAGAFELYFKRGISRNEMTLTELNKLCKTKCVLMELEFKNFHIKDGVTLPCLSVDKCNKGRCSSLIYTIDGKKRGNDNGKVLHMDGITKLSLLELDYHWIMRQYTTDAIRIHTVYIAERGKHPDYVLNVINKYFEIKENAEGVERDKSKNNLNAGYGMEATDIVRSEIKFDIESHEWTEEKPITPEDIQKSLDKYYKSRNSFMQYFYGCYVTMHARADILLMVETRIGYNYFIYCDTDSIFFIWNEISIDKIRQYNDDVITLNKKMGLGVKNKDGNMSYYGVFEDEKKDIVAFKFLHSKCYGYIGKDGLKMTIAGVRQKFRDFDNTIVTIVDELKGGKNIDDFKALDEKFHSGTVFHKCGGISATYTYSEPRVINIDGHLTDCAGACILRPCTKTLNDVKWLTKYYEESEVDTECIYL